MKKNSKKSYLDSLKYLPTKNSSIVKGKKVSVDSTALVFGPRRYGKTTFLLDWLEKKENRILLCFSSEEKRRLCRERPPLEERIQTIFEFKNYRIGREEMEVAIDNLDGYFSQLFGFHPSVVSLTCDNDFKKLL